MPQTSSPGRTRVERGIYRQPNGNYAVCARRGCASTPGAALLTGGATSHNECCAARPIPRN